MLHIELTVERSFLKHLKNVLSVQMPVIAETSLENNPETTNYPTSLGNNSDQRFSSVCLPPNFGEFQIMHITMFNLDVSTSLMELVVAHFFN